MVLPTLTGQSRATAPNIRCRVHQPLTVEGFLLLTYLKTTKQALTTHVHLVNVSADQQRKSLGIRTFSEEKRTEGKVLI